jgi:hypothetical protein
VTPARQRLAEAENLTADLEIVSQLVLPGIDLRLQLLQRHVRALDVQLLRLDRLGEALLVSLEVLHAVKPLAQLAFEGCGVLLRRVGLYLRFLDLFFELGKLASAARDCSCAALRRAASLSTSACAFITRSSRTLMRFFELA